MWLHGSPHTAPDRSSRGSPSVSICAVLRDVVNLFISDKVPVLVARFFAGG